MFRSSLRLGASATLLFLAVGCPHRTPVWSPDGSYIVVLAGKSGEEIDKAASQLWLVEPAVGTAKALACPEKDVRYLAAAWVDDATIAVLTGIWKLGSIDAGSEKLWRVPARGGDWAAVPAPPPSGENAPKKPPVVIGEGATRAIVYPSDAEAVVVADFAAGKELLKLDPAELIGPGPAGGFLVSRPQADDAATIEVAAYGADLKVLWRRKLSDLREGIARKLGKQPLEVVFNATGTSELPRAGEAGWIGLELIFSDVGWKDGIPGYFARLDVKTGEVMEAARAVGLSGRPAVASGVIWAVLAPDKKQSLPPRVARIQLADGKEAGGMALAGVEKEAVHGYSLGPAGKIFAVSVNSPTPSLRLFDIVNPANTKVIELK